MSLHFPVFWTDLLLGDDLYVFPSVWSDEPNDVEIQTGNTETSPQEREPEALHSRLTRSMAQIPPTTVSSAAVGNQDKSGTPEASGMAHNAIILCTLLSKHFDHKIAYPV